VSASAPQGVPAAKAAEVDQVNVFAILSRACCLVLRDRVQVARLFENEVAVSGLSNWAYSSAG
jgi:hypothetical protein